MKRKRITIYDLAEELNISPTTVSRALSGHQGIAKETVDLVQRHALKRGYKRNVLASGLRTKKTKCIGVLIPQIDRSFMAKFISGIEEIANQAGYTVIISQSLDDQQKEVQCISSLISNSVDGIIMSLAMNSETYDHLQQVLDHKIPLILADRVIEDLDSDKVVVDNFNAAYNVTQYLINSGHQRIAHLAGSPIRNVYGDRRDGYLSALNDNNIPFKEELLIYSNLSEEAGVLSIQKLLELDQVPDAVFAANDTSAVSALMFLKKIGMKIPEQISVVGFNNDPISAIVTPRLSTVEHPAYDIGCTAAKRLLERINSDQGQVIENKTIVLKTSLIIGESSPQLSVLQSESLTEVHTK